MIMVEGPDGAGKTTLVNQLVEKYDFLPVKRDMTSGVSAYQWMIDELQTWEKGKIIRIYDRFPLIGEKIHGPILRGKMEPAFNERESMKLLLMRVTLDSLIIYCRPPLGNILANSLEESEEIVGNIRQIVKAYDRLFQKIPCIRFSYPKDSIGILDQSIREHIGRWKSDAK